MADQLDIFGKHGGGGGGKNGVGAGGAGDGSEPVLLREVARRRYLNYALSVITSRALPDVRDGLKPVQRRILYAMFHGLHLYPDAKFKKSASVVGEVIGKYHPHGDTAIYDAMVRMAQWFSLRTPLVDGHGNFGDLSGDAAAAYRYTEARLTPAAMLLLDDLRNQTVDFRPTFDGQHQEPAVLPARFPNLLVNGATGIAVGMATNIPPHNLGEVCAAAVALIDDPALETKDPLRHVRGPDFPTGGRILSTKAELRAIYETGQGTVKVRGEYTVEELARGKQQIVVTSIPYALDRDPLVASIGEVVASRKLPLLLDVRDESTSDVRIVLELKPGSDAAAVMAYLFKHTQLQTNFAVNLTCLVPTGVPTSAGPQVCGPERLDLKSMLRHFLDFRLQVVRRRIEHQLRELRKRIHLLEGFEKIFDALDEAIRIIRKSDGKDDARQKLCKRFALDDEQAEAVLETKLYKLARLEIEAIRKELGEKRAEAKKLETILASEARLWGVVKKEIVELSAERADRRRSKLGGTDDEPEFDPEAYIVAEDNDVVVSRDGWIKRAREIKDIGTTRLREGDSVLTVLRTSTKENVVLFSNQGGAYVIRANDLPATTGYGEPVQKLFKFDDGERVIAALTLDARSLKKPAAAVLLAVSRQGLGLRFPLEPHLEASTRAGRRYAKTGDGDEIVGVTLANEEGASLVVVTEQGKALRCEVGQVNLLGGPGKGVQVIKVEPGDRVLGFGVGAPIRVETVTARAFDVGRQLELQERGGKGSQVTKRGERLARVVPPPIVLVREEEK